MVELLCACVQTLKESVLFSVTKPGLPSWEVYRTPALTVQAPRFAPGSSCFLQYSKILCVFQFVTSAAGTAAPVTCLLLFVCLVSFVLFSQFLLVSPFLLVIDRLRLYTSVGHLCWGGCTVSVLRWLQLFTRQGG